MTNIDWIFFDLGWTLVDETEAHRARLDPTQHYLAEFGRVHSVDELGLAKPDPRIFASALSEAGCRPQNALMVGDRIDSDIGPAKSQAWNTVRVLQGFSRFQEPRGPQEIPDITISTVLELADSNFVQVTA